MDESTKRGLLAAYGRLLKPLVRILIRNGVVYDEFAEVAKHTFVRVALDQQEEKNSRQSAETLAQLVGITGDEFTSIETKLASAQDHSSELFDDIVSILGAWHTKSELIGPYGLPIELPLEAPTNIDFTTLAKSCTTNASPTDILKELIATSAVTETKPGWYKVKTRYYMPEGSAPGGIEHLSRTIEDIANTIDHNHSEPNQSRRMFERHVYTEDGIRSEDLPRFAEFAGKKAQTLIEEIDNWLTGLEKPDETDRERLSTGFGIFHYVHNDKQ